MSKKFGTHTILPNCEEKAIKLVTERGHTIAWRFYKITMTTLVFLFIFCLGFILSELRDTARHQMDDFDQYVYAYDTEQKIEDYYKERERQLFDYPGILPESPSVEEAIAMMRGERPLAIVGPFFIVIDNDSSTFSVREKQSLLPLVELNSNEHSKKLHFYSLQEKNYGLPRFQATTYHSEDGIHEKSSVHLHGKDGKFHRFYLDTKGTGIFDAMYVYENKVLTRYKLNGLSWERADEQPFTETLETDLDMEKVVE